MSRMAKHMAEEVRPTMTREEERLSERARAGLKRATERVREGFEHGGTKITNGFHHAGSGLRSTERHVRGVVRERPYLSVATALGAGFGLAALLGWFRHRRASEDWN